MIGKIVVKYGENYAHLRQSQFLGNGSPLECSFVVVTALGHAASLSCLGFVGKDGQQVDTDETRPWLSTGNRRPDRLPVPLSKTLRLR